ncbi:MAG: thioredoxin domain-containing protein [Candidatus Binataceae bacterium]
MRTLIPATEIGRATAVLAAALALCLIATGFPCPASAAEPAPCAPGRKLAGTNPARDKAIVNYLEKHFKLPPDSSTITLGPATDTRIHGLYCRDVTVKIPVPNDPMKRTRTISTALYVDKDQKNAILGQLLDLTKDPWGRISLAKIHLDDRPVLGSSDAPVTVVEFADFECPYCAHAFGQIETLVDTSYKGKIKLIFKAFPLGMHPWAFKAAEYAECARMQNPDAFWSFARYFYSNQPQINPTNLSDKVNKLAGDLKLDGTALRACAAGTQAAKRVKQDQADGNAIHVNSTPTFYVDGIPVVGLPNDQAFEYVVNSELARLKQKEAAR